MTPGDSEFRSFIIKNTVIASALTWLVGAQVRSLSLSVVDTLVEPLFSIDLHGDGNPDLKQLDKYATKVLGLNIPLGKMVMEVIKTIVTLLILYCIVKLFMKYTTFIKM